MAHCLQMGGLPSRRCSLRSSSHLFPLKFFTNVIIEAMSNVLVGVNSVRTTIGEMLRYVGMWMLMSCYMKSLDYFWQPEAWANEDDEDRENDTSLFTFNRYMSQQWLVAIMLALQFMSSNLPMF